MSDGIQGAVDQDYDEAERSPREQLEATLAQFQTQPVEGGVAIDLVTRQPLYIRRRVADSVVEYYDEEGFDLASYKTHPYLPVQLDDPVYECVFVPRDAESIHSISKTYDFPRGRLATVPVWTAWGDADA